MGKSRLVVCKTSFSCLRYIKVFDHTNGAAVTRNNTKCSHRPVVIVMVVMVPVVPSARSPFRITLFQTRDQVEEPPYEVGVDRAGDGGKDSASGLGPSATVMRVPPGWRRAGPVTKSILFC